MLPSFQTPELPTLYLNLRCLYHCVSLQPFGVWLTHGKMFYFVGLNTQFLSIYYCCFLNLRTTFSQPEITEVLGSFTLELRITDLTPFATEIRIYSRAEVPRSVAYYPPDNPIPTLHGWLSTLLKIKLLL